MAYFRVCGRRRRRVRDEAHFPKLLVCLWGERLIGCVTVPNSLAPADLVWKGETRSMRRRRERSGRQIEPKPMADRLM